MGINVNDDHPTSMMIIQHINKRDGSRGPALPLDLLGVVQDLQLDQPVVPHLPRVERHVIVGSMDSS
jgi:hypothetical protein